MTRAENLRILERAEAAADDGGYDEAIRLCDQMVFIDDADNVAALNLKGYCLIKMGRPVDALSFLRPARLHLSVYAPICYNLGLALEEVGDLDAALTEYDAAITLQNDNLAALLSRGMLLQQMGNEPAAMRDFDTMIHTHPENPHGYMRRATCHMFAGRYPEAHADFLKVVDLEPTYKSLVDEIIRHTLPNADAAWWSSLM